MEIVLNGQGRFISEDINIIDLLKQLEINLEKVVVEVNYQIIAKEQYGQHRLHDGDQVEVVSFVGGG